MSSFRVERQRVSFFAQAEMVQPSPKPACRDDDFDRQRQELAREKENALHTKKYAKQLLEDSRQEAEQILQKAKHEAEIRLNDAQEQAEQLRQQEKKRGYDEGWKEAQAAGQQWKKKEQEKMKQASDRLEVQYQSKVDEVEKASAELAMEITKKIIGIKLEEDDTAFLNVIHAAMARFRQTDNIIIRLNSEDYRRYTNTESITHADEAQGRSIILEQDESLGKGDCVLETENQFVDCGVHGQLERVEKILREVDGEEQEHEQNFAKVQGSLAQN